jgi:hypothetical protein
MTAMNVTPGRGYGRRCWVVLTGIVGPLAALVAMLVTVSSCSQRQVDIAEDDHTATCEAACATVHSCASDPVDDNEAECVTNCREPGEGLWQAQSCDALADELLRCLAGMTCEQYAVYESDLANSVCHEETLDYSVCLSEEVE